MDVVGYYLFLSIHFKVLFISRRNTVIVDFITWLRKYNTNQLDEQKKKVGFFGIDLYSLQSSREEVIDYLEKTAPSLLNISNSNSIYFVK